MTRTLGIEDLADLTVPSQPRCRPTASGSSTSYARRT